MSLILSLLFGVTGLADQSKPAVPERRSLAAQVVGTWQLVSIDDRDAAGRISADSSLGRNPLGYLIYDATDHMATQSMKRDRPATASTISARSNNISFVNGYHAYFGTYTVDERAATVTHRIDGALSPADVGKVLTRQIRLVGDDLTIAFQTLSTDGVQVTRVLKWTRVG